MEINTHVHAVQKPSTGGQEIISRLTRQEIIGLFAPLELRYTGGQYHDKVFAYRLYIPSQLDKGAKYPILLWLHGAGKWGDDNERQLIHLDEAIALFMEEKGAFPGFVLAPQAPKGVEWFGTRSTEEEMLTITWAMLERAIQEYPIDEDRISLTGVSSGGNACWEMAMRHPGQFAAVAPMGSSGGDELRADQLLGTPIWAFHNVLDTKTPIQGVRQTVDAVQEAGGWALLTEIPTVIGHACWTAAFHDYDLLALLLARRRGDWIWKPTVQFWDWWHTWEWWQLAAQIGLPVLVVSAIVRERRRREKAGPRKAESESFNDNLTHEA